MRISYFASVAACAVVCAVKAYCELPNPEHFSDTELGKYYPLEFSRSFALALRQLPSESKAAWIARVQRYRRENAATEGVGDGSYDNIMFAAGDPETQQKYARRFNSIYDPPGAVLAAADPAFAALIGDLILGDNRDPSSYDLVLMGKASTAWEVVKVTLRAAPEFSAEVKQWARAVPCFYSGEGEELQIEREWWKANREAMRAGRYGEVKPGRLNPQWLVGLPELDPPFEPGQPSEPVRFGELGSPAVMAMDYERYLEGKKTGKEDLTNPGKGSGSVQKADPALTPNEAHRRTVNFTLIASTIAVLIAAMIWFWKKLRGVQEKK